MECSRLKVIWNKVKIFLPVTLGALGGFLYYNLIGCNGSCAITGNLVNSALYGSLFGLILTDWKQVGQLLKKSTHKNITKGNEQE